MSKTYEYIFRFCCDPGFNDKEEIARLESFVDEALIDDVAVFANVQELNVGHMTFEEQDVFLDLIKNVMSSMKKKDITVSVNHWHSLMHADIGKKLREAHNFRRMTDIDGKEAELCVCPLDKNWQDYIGSIYARYAALEPSILWIEDDFRLHNHMPLNWGGCFCSEHLSRFSERVGHEIKRSELVSALLQPGTPHPYRKIWLDLCRESMEEAAAAITGKVREVSAEVKMGLMSSAPHIPAAEGRNWTSLFKIIGGGQAPVNRIHLPAYQENTAARYMEDFNRVSMLTRAFLPDDCEIYPELENYPYSLFSKSKKFTRFQLLASLPLNLNGMTIDLYDLNGNGIIEDEGYQSMLKEVKPYLQKLQSLNVFSGKSEGVKVLCSEKSSYTIETPEGKEMSELYPAEAYWAALLPSMGIPFSYACHPENLKNEIIAVSGQVLRNYDKDQMEDLFAENFLMLTAEAIITLESMGLGSLAGVKAIKRLPQNAGFYTYEEVTNGKIYSGRKRARASAVISAADALDVSYDEDVSKDEFTALYDSFRRRRANGQTLVNQNVFIYPFGPFEAPGLIPPMFLNRVRAEILQDLLIRQNVSFPIVLNQAYLIPYAYKTEDGHALYLLNASSDCAENIRLRLPENFRETLTIYSSETHTEKEIKPLKSEGHIKTYPCKIHSMEALLIEFNSLG